MRHFRAGCVRQYWLGLEQLADQSAMDVGWNWVINGQLVSASGLNWKSGEPNDFGVPAEEDNRENCGTMAAASGEIRDVQCNNNAHTVCQLTGMRKLR